MGDLLQWMKTLFVFKELHWEAKLLVGGSWLFLLCYLAVVGVATMGVGSCSGA